MLKVGVVGLGDIAGRAYLPVISAKKIEVHLCTRNERVLREFGAQYRFNHLHTTIDSLLGAGIQCAFVHAATPAHFEIIHKLLSHRIHVYVDKPITTDLASTKDLVTLAESRNLVLMTGFNRRYAPAIRQLKDLKDPNMVVMHKHRKSLPDPVRRFIFDDFIHVVDTLLFLLDDPACEIIARGRQEGNQLFHVVVHMSTANGRTALGIMNRDSGTVEEKIEVFTPTGKTTVSNLSETESRSDSGVLISETNAWEPTLQKRGFEQIIDAFLEAVRSGMAPEGSIKGSLETHRICEEIVETLSET